MPEEPRDLVLHAYWRSSASYRVRLALAAKQLTYRVVPVNILRGEQSAEAHLGLSATGYVPSLVVDGVPFFESMAIVALLDELYPEPPLYPGDPFTRARVRALVDLVCAGIQPLHNLNVLHRFPEGNARRDWAQHFIGKGLTALERAIAAHEAQGITGSFAVGDALTAADLAVIPQLYQARRFHVDLAPFPRVVRAEASARAYPGLDAAAPEHQPDAIPTG